MHECVLMTADQQRMVTLSLGFDWLTLIVCCETLCMPDNSLLSGTNSVCEAAPSPSFRQVCLFVGSVRSNYEGTAS
jgi:hypothetical protein